MKIFTNKLQARCRTCFSSAETKPLVSSSFWWCSHCKDEVEVNLVTTTAPKGELYGYQNKEGGIRISEPGIYLLTYLDGTYEWYEHKPGTRDTVVSGDLLRSADRIAERDLPSRKRVQSVPGSGAGAEDEGLRLRTVSSPPDSVYGRVVAFKESDLTIIPDYDFISKGKVPGISGPISSGVPKSSKTKMWDLDGCDQRIQHGSVPPDDPL